MKKIAALTLGLAMAFTIGTASAQQQHDPNAAQGGMMKCPMMGEHAKGGMKCCPMMAKGGNGQGMKHGMNCPMMSGHQGQQADQPAQPATPQKQ